VLVCTVCVIYLSLIVKHAQIHSWNQPVLRNYAKVSFARKQR